MHFDNMTDGYMRFLRKAGNGEIAYMSDNEIEATIYALVAARSYLAMRYFNPDEPVDVPEEAAKAHMRLVTRGLTGDRDYALLPSAIIMSE